MMLLNCRGATGETILMMYRFLIIAVIASVIFGVASFVYSYDVRESDTEARLLSRSLTLCLLELDVSMLSAADEYSLFSVCGFSGDLDRLAAQVTLSSEGFSDVVLSDGDLGRSWLVALSESELSEGVIIPGVYSVSHRFDVRGFGGVIDTVLVEVYVYD